MTISRFSKLCDVLAPLLFPLAAHVFLREQCASFALAMLQILGAIEKPTSSNDASEDESSDSAGGNDAPFVDEEYDGYEVTPAYIRGVQLGAAGKTGFLPRSAPKPFSKSKAPSGRGFPSVPKATCRTEPSLEGELRGAAASSKSKSRERAGTFCNACKRPRAPAQAKDRNFCSREGSAKCLIFQRQLERQQRTGDGERPRCGICKRFVSSSKKKELHTCQREGSKVVRAMKCRPPSTCPASFSSVYHCTPPFLLTLSAFCACSRSAIGTHGTMAYALTIKEGVLRSGTPTTTRAHL